MRLSDVLKLPKEAHSLSIIKDYLEQSLGQNDYQAAFNYYFKIAIHLNLFDLVFEEAKQLVHEISFQNDSPYYEEILGSLVAASIHLEKYDEAKTYIAKRKQALPVLKSYLGILDEIAYKKVLNLSYKDDLLHLLKDVVPSEVKIFALAEIYQIYLNEKHYEMALNSLYELYHFDLQSSYFDQELQLLLLLKKDEEAKEKALERLRLDPHHAQSVLTLLTVYYNEQNFHKATTLEAQYEDVIDQQDEAFKKDAYELIVRIYQAIGNRFSEDVYQKKYKALIKSIDKKEKAKPIKVEQNEQEIVVIEKVSTQQVSKTHKIEHFDYFGQSMLFASLLDDKLPLREFLRQFFIHFDREIKAKDYAIYLTEQSPNLFHYKVERLYDKTVLKQALEQTVVERTLATGEDIAEPTERLRWQKNIITQSDYDDETKFVFSFPIGDIGVFLIYLQEDISDPSAYYDLFKLIAAYLFTHFNSLKQQQRIRYENQFYQKVVNNPWFAYRELREERSTYNDAARQLLQIDKHHHLELFLRDVSYADVHHYQEAVRYLFTHPNQTKSLLYTYQNKQIKEQLFSLQIQDEVVVMSQFFDETERIEETKTLTQKATVDEETLLSNTHALHMELETLLSDKASLLLIELDTSIKHIYGHQDIVQYFKEFAQITKKFFSSKTYRFDFNQILVVIPQNDIRSVTKLVKDYFKQLQLPSQVLKYEPFGAKMAIVRYPVVTIQQQKDKLFRYLGIALEKCKRENQEDYYFFVYRDYEDEMFEQQVIDQMNLAIESKSLSLVFSQITDIKKNRVWQYESDLHIPNLSIDSKYLFMIARKRHRLIDLEKHHIQKVCEFLVELEKQTERLIKLTIPISKETFLSHNFNSYVLGLFKSYQIPYEFIRFKFDMDLRAHHYAGQIQELIDAGISLDTTSLDMALSYPFHALHLDIKKENIKWNSYLVKVKELLEGFRMALVIRGLKTKEQKEAVERLGISYVEGQLYKQLPAPVLLNKVKESV